MNVFINATCSLLDRSGTLKGSQIHIYHEKLRRTAHFGMIALRQEQELKSEGNNKYELGTS